MLDCHMVGCAPLPHPELADFAFCRFDDLYVLALSDLQRKEWSVLKFIDDFYASLEEQLREVRVPAGWPGTRMCSLVHALTALSHLHSRYQRHLSRTTSSE